jgi:Tol biopolymer transport system component/predicted Ser/Thr protein kinase
MPLVPGTRLGPYQILAPIGAGGMGEVYRSRDTKLDREVAIKILPEALARDPERVARFEREAKVLAALNHPNIAQIYGIEESNAGRALVMELVPGETLKGPLPVDAALNYAKQVAEALEAAHDKGIIHRDLKPANLMVTPERVVKVLDFGLAAVTQAPQGEAPAEAGATLTMGATQAGMIMGTAAYMAPEQAAGKPVDRRADIWSFGVVLWEMLTGHRLFDGETVSHTLADVLRAEIDFGKLPRETPAAIRGLLRRCLDRDVKNRLRDIGEARIAIQRAGQEPAAVAPVTQGRRSWLWPGVATVLLLGLGTPAVLHLREKGPAAPEPVQFQIVPPEKLAATSHLYLSPNGRQLLFTGVGPDGRERLWVRALDALDSRPLPGTESSGNPSLNPFWSADSRFIAFSVSGKLKKIAVTGGPPQTLCDTADGDTGGGAWNQDGVIIFGSTRQGLFRVSSAGGVASPLTVLDSSRQEEFHRRPVFLPDGRHFLYLRVSNTPDNTGIFVGSLDAKPEEQSRKRLLSTQIGVAYASSSDPNIGYMLFLRDDTLMAQLFDERRLELTAEPVPVAEQVGRNSLTTGYFTASATGTLAYRSGGATSSLLTWFNRQGRALGTAGDPGQYGELALSPDGTRVAFARRDGGNEDIWLLDLARGVNTRFTFDPAPDRDPVWSPDGTWIAFTSTRKGHIDLYQKPANGAGEDQLLLQSSEPKYPQDWSRDGHFLLYTVLGKNSGSDLWVLPTSGSAPGSAKHAPFLATPFSENHGQFSPDGRWVAYTSNESGGFDVYVRSFPASSEGGGKWQVSKGGGRQPRWRRDGRELFYFSPDNKLMAVEVSAGPTFKAGVPKPLFAGPILRSENLAGWYWDVASDGQRFLIETGVEDANSSAMTVVLNWTGLLKK